MRWYADDTDLRTISDVHIPNIVMFGGVVVDKDNEKLLRETFEDAKSKFCHKRLPLKWNFKDLKDKYRKQKKEEEFSEILSNMYDIRKSIFEAVSEVDFKIIISIVIGYSKERKVLKDLQSDLARHVFSNSMMRYALHVQETSPERAEVILDWPSNSDSTPFDTEYASAYNNGRTKEGVPYHSGTLEKLHFHDSIFYTRTPHSTIMQLTDMILGATREFVQCSITETDATGQGIHFLEQLAPKFRGYPNNVIGRGISINSQASNEKNNIQRKFNELYVDKLNI